MPQLRCRFLVVEMDVLRPPNVDVTLRAMYDDTIPDDQQFVNNGVSGTIKVQIDEADANTFRVGAVFYVDFTPVAVETKSADVSLPSTSEMSAGDAKGDAPAPVPMGAITGTVPTGGTDETKQTPAPAATTTDAGAIADQTKQVEAAEVTAKDQGADNSPMPTRTPES